jgi:hypothetical protein
LDDIPCQDQQQQPVKDPVGLPAGVDSSSPFCCCPSGVLLLLLLLLLLPVWCAFAALAAVGWRATGIKLLQVVQMLFPFLKPLLQGYI